MADAFSTETGSDIGTSLEDSYSSVGSSSDYNNEISTNATATATEPAAPAESATTQSQAQSQEPATDTFEEYFSYQGVEPQPVYQPQQQFVQQPAYQPQVQQQAQPRQIQQQDLYTDFAQIQELAKGIETIDLGLTDEQIVDMMDKDPKSFANAIAKTAINQVLDLVGKFDIQSMVQNTQQESLTDFSTKMEAQRSGQEFITATNSVLSQSGLYLNDQQAELVYSTLASQFPQAYQQYQQAYNFVRVTGDVKNSKVPHVEGRMLSAQEFAQKQVIQYAKGVTKGQQSHKPQQKVVTNQIYNQGAQAQKQVTDLKGMSDEQFDAYRANLGF